MRAGDKEKELSELQYKVTQEAATERPFTGAYWGSPRATASYRCVVCDAPLFDSGTKFDSGTGWPSFPARPGQGRGAADTSHGMGASRSCCAELRRAPRPRLRRRPGPDRAALLHQLGLARLRGARRGLTPGPGRRSPPWRSPSSPPAGAPPGPGPRAPSRRRPARGPHGRAVRRPAGGLRLRRRPAASRAAAAHPPGRGRRGGAVRSQRAGSRAAAAAGGPAAGDPPSGGAERRCW